jgi:PTS system ascorbate-specific IIC component
MGVVLTILIAAVLVIGAIIYQLKVVDGGWVPGARRDAWVAEYKAVEKAELDATKDRLAAEKAANAATTT